MTNLSDLSADKSYVLYNQGSVKYNYYTSSQIGVRNTIDNSSFVSLNYSDNKVTIKQESTNTYYQGLSNGTRVTLGKSAVNYTFTKTGNAFYVESNNLYLNTNNTGNLPKGAAKSNSGSYSKWYIYEVSMVEIEDDHCYTIDFVSYDGTKTWGLRSGTTEATANASGTGDVYVAHSFTNSSGQERWIFVNNSNGTYLAYHGKATSVFDKDNPISEFSIEGIWAGKSSYTNAESNSTAADYSSKVCITGDKRYTDVNDLGCYILKEANGAYDNSSAPYYNGSFTSALKFTATGDEVSATAAAAIAKVDAYYEVKPYLAYASNISALFADPSSIVTNINAATTAEAAHTVATNFMKSPEGKKFYAVNSTATSQYMNVTTSLVSATSNHLTTAGVMEVEYAGNSKYYLKGVQSEYYACAPVDGNTAPATVSSTLDAGLFYIGNTGSTDNRVYFSTAKAGDYYIEAIHYNSSKTYKTCGWGYDSGASQWDITYITDEEYTAMLSASSTTISYTLTDMNGAEYKGTFEGKIYDMDTDKGDVPTITGCDGYTFSDEVWDYSGKTYTATITFPFDVTSNSITNYTYIASFNAANYYWYATSDNTSVWVKKDEVPYHTNYQNYDWSIEPVWSAGAFTFKIKNRTTNTYITSTSNSDSHIDGTVSLSADGTSLTFIYGKNKNDNNYYYRWVLPTSKQLSLNSSTNTGAQRIGTYYAHNGTGIGIFERSDFETLIANFAVAAAAFAPYSSLIGSDLGQYSGNQAATMKSVYEVSQSGESAFTATTIANNTTILENPTTKLTLNMPSAGQFLYVIGGNSENYVRYGDKVDSRYPMGDVNQTAIFYYDGTHMLSYSSGIYWGVTGGNGTTNWDWTTVGSTGSEIRFAESNTIGKYFIKLTAVEEAKPDVLLYDNTTRCDRGGFNGTSGVTDARYTWKLKAVTSLPLETNADGYTTFSAPVPMTIPSDCNAYIAENQGDGVINMAKVTGDVAANTGLIISTRKYDDNELTFNIAASGTEYSGNLLHENVAASNVDKTNNYFFGKTGNDYVFTKISGEGTRTLAGHKAYLDGTKLSGTTARLAISWDNVDDPTGLNEINTENIGLKDGKYYQNGNVFIVRNGIKYNVAGQIMK